MNDEINSFKNISKVIKSRNNVSSINLQSYLTNTLSNINFTETKNYNSNEIITSSERDICNIGGNHNKNENYPKKKSQNSIPNYFLDAPISNRIKNFVYFSQKDLSKRLIYIFI